MSMFLASSDACVCKDFTLRRLLTFDQKRTNQASTFDVVRDVVIPFMKQTRSREIIMECTTVCYKETIYKEIRENDIVPYPSGGRTFDVKGGYPLNSQVCMPCKLINGHLKENARKPSKDRENEVAV